VVVEQSIAYVKLSSYFILSCYYMRKKKYLSLKLYKDAWLIIWSADSEKKS
jgi:hypothetical protein